MMNAASKVFGIICFLFLLALGIRPSNIGFFIDPIAFIFVFGGTAALLLSSLGVEGVKRLFMNLLSEDPEQQYFVQRSLKYTCVYFLGNGALDSLIGFVFMLQNLDDPSTLGTSLAVASLPYLYAVLSCCCILPLIFNVSAGAEAGTKHLLPLIVLGFLSMPILNGSVYFLMLYTFTG